MFQRRRLANTYLIKAAVAVLCLVWVGAALAKQPPAVTQLIANAREAVHTIDMKAFHALLREPDHGLVIDVREPNEYASGHVPGAVNIPRGLIEFRIWKQIDYPKVVPADVKLTIYCQSGGRAVLAAKSLRDLGFYEVTAVNMNLKDWADEGYQLTLPESK